MAVLRAILCDNYNSKSNPMNPVSDTAFYTCGIRARDAESEKSICNDKYAQRFMNTRGLEVFAEFSGDKMGSHAHIARHTMIDKRVGARVLADPKTTVVSIGAGFDSRAYRTHGGRWIELDEPGIVEYKNGRLAPTDCPNELTRIAINFKTECLSERLPNIDPETNVVVVIEGVFFYLTEAQISETLKALRSAYPRHVLICDLMTRKFIESRNKKIHKKLQKMNAPFKFLADTPSLTFIQAGYRVYERASIISRTIALILGSGMASIFSLIMREMAGGYSVYTFEMPDA